MQDTPVRALGVVVDIPSSRAEIGRLSGCLTMARFGSMTSFSTGRRTRTAHGCRPTSSELFFVGSIRGSMRPTPTLTTSTTSPAPCTRSSSKRSRCAWLSRTTYLIEGFEILPTDVGGYEARFGETRSCFLGDSAISAADLRAYRGENPWHEVHAQSELEGMASRIPRWSAQTAEERRRHGRDYIHMGQTGFEDGIARGLALLLGGR